MVFGNPPFTGIFSCYRLPRRALPPKNEIPSTVKKLPSRLFPSDGITVRFMSNRLPANKYRQLTVDTAKRVPPTLDTARRVPPTLETLDTAQNAPSAVCCAGCRATCGGCSFIFCIFWSEGSTGSLSGEPCMRVWTCAQGVSRTCHHAHTTSRPAWSAEV